MHQPDIAPLARRLAEENNVDWRRLQGSGDGGRVVERDVLEYLARVMAGDEALDPTPEPVPEGMTAWPEADVRMLHDDDDEDLLEGTSTVEDDIFLFDDDLAGADPPAAGAAPGDLDTPEPADAAFDIDVDADLAEDVAVDVGGHRGDAAAPAGVAAAPDAAGVDDLAGVDELAGVDDIDEDDLLVSGDGEPEPVVATQVEPVPAAPPDVATEAHDPDGLPDLFAAADPAVPGAAEPDDGSPALFAADDHEVLEPRWDAGPELEDDLALPEMGMAVEAGPDLDEAPEATASAVAAPEVAPEVAADAAPEVAPEVAPDAAPDAAPVAPPLVPAVEAEGEPPPVAEPARAPGATDAALPLWSHGHVWRRHIDLSALVAAQLDVAGELGREEPIPLAAFLVRAAHKALGGQGAVALAVVDAGGARTVPVPAAADFVQAVAAYEAALTEGALTEGARAEGGLADEAGAEGEAREPDLIVSDLSDLGVDDAVLRLGAPVLTLGRVLIDTQSGGRRAVLALAGDGADGPGAARRLARVADLLEAPVRVVL